MKGIDQQYLDLIKDVLDNGVIKETRNGETLSVFGRQIRHKMTEGFPLLTTKRMYYKGIFTELIWFLRGDTDIKFLIDNNTNVWNGDAYEFLKRKSRHSSTPVPSKPEMINKIKTTTTHSHWSDLGPIYGKQWRDFNGVDQIKKIITTLLTNPDDRRMLLSAWNPAQLDPLEIALPPCHYGFQVYSRELSTDELSKHSHLPNHPTRALSLSWNQRSVDTGLGLPFDIASYGLLLEILAKITNMIPDELIGILGDTHIYTNQIDGLVEQLERKPFELPTIKHNLSPEFYRNIRTDLSLFDSMKPTDFEIINYKSHPRIKLPLSN